MPASLFDHRFIVGSFGNGATIASVHNELSSSFLYDFEIILYTSASRLSIDTAYDPFVKRVLPILLHFIVISSVFAI